MTWQSRNVILDDCCARLSAFGDQVEGTVEARAKECLLLESDQITNDEYLVWAAGSEPARI